MTFAQQADGLADDLTSRGVKATSDPRAAGRQPIVLVAPPEVDFVRRTTTWTLVALAGTHDTGKRTKDTLLGLVEATAAVCAIESARPSFYQLVSDQPAYPAYLMTLTGGLP